MNDGLIEKYCNIHPKALEFCTAIENHDWWVVAKFVLLGAVLLAATFLAKWLKDTKKWTSWLARSDNGTQKKN